MANQGTYVIVRNNEAKLRIQGSIEHDGSFRATTGERVMDGETAEELGIFEEQKALVMARRFNELDPRVIAGIHLSQTGLRVVPEADWQAEQKACMLPGERARLEIVRLQARAERLIDSPADDAGEGYALREQARQMMEAWKLRYPDLAAQELERDLRAEAARLRDLAAGALTFDADGWLPAEEKVRRHDEYMAQARAIELRIRDKKLGAQG